MIWTRRRFLRSALTGAVVLPLATKGLTSSLFAATNPATTAENVALFEELERASFDFFWHEADPRTGLVRDRAIAEGGDVRTVSSIAATGFGLTALCIGHQNNYGDRQEITARVRKTLHFLAHQAPQVHGFLYHFVDMQTSKRRLNSEISPIDMSILLCGALTCREYFQDEQIRRDATQLYNRVDWPWALNGGDTFAMGWIPEMGFSSVRWDTYCESNMLYLLAMGSTTHPIPVQCWHSIRRPWMTYDNIRFISTPAPLFIHQFSHAWFDFRDKEDDYTDYFQNSVLASRAHRKFCLKLSDKFPSYSKSIWGITASDSSTGYVVWGGPPKQGPIDGTIVPSAAAGSLPFLFNESATVLKNLREKYGDKVWKRYGFVDAFNPLTGWASPDVLGIDLGISMVMAENARTQMVWNTFMRNPEVRTAMDIAGFHSPGPYNTEYALAASSQTNSDNQQ